MQGNEKKLRLMPGANLTFVTGSTIYCPSNLKDRKQRDGHKRDEKETEHEKAKAAGSELPPRKVSEDPPPTYSTITPLLPTSKMKWNYKNFTMSNLNLGHTKMKVHVVISLLV